MHAVLATMEIGAASRVASHNSYEEIIMIRELGTVSAETKGPPSGNENGLNGVGA